MKAKLLFSFLLILIITLPAFPQAGTLDNSFSGDGKLLIEFGNIHDNGRAIHIMPDNSSIVLGNYSNDFTNSVGILFKILENGDIDSTFGVNGIYTELQYGDALYPWKMIHTSTDQLLIAGTINIGSNNEKMFVARYNLDGTHDASFGNGGHFQSNFSMADNEGCEAIYEQADGKIVIAGRSYQGSFSKLLFARLNSDGTLDTGFGTNGYTDIDESIQGECIYDLSVLSDGTIVGVGDGYHSDPYWGHRVLMAKLDANGDPITSFGGNGVVTPVIFDDISTARRIVARNDSLFLTGYIYDTDNASRLYITKLNSDGIGDPGFGNNGITISTMGLTEFGFDILLQGDGKILVAGIAGQGPFAGEFLIARYSPTGALDNSWNGVGYTLTDFRVDSDEIYGMGMLNDGRIMTVGFSLGLNSPPEEGNRIPMALYQNDYSPFQADFSASDTLICVGSTVTFTDESPGSISRTWTFDGGTPSSSTQSNPTVTYNTAGIYDVTIEAFNGTLYSTLTKYDHIEVIDGVPDQPLQPMGATAICETQSTDYNIDPAQNAVSYDWEVSPPEAGTIIGSGTTASFTASDSWYGPYTIKVRGENVCGFGAWSPELQCESYHMPDTYWLEGDGAYCTGTGGAELTLDGSETDIDYELYRDGAATGNIVAGTGSPISFGMIDEDGMYTVLGFNANCSESMYGEVWVHEIQAPEQPDMPVGPTEVCAVDTAFYSTNPDPAATGYTWTLNPPEAGNLIEIGGSTIQVVYEAGFSGAASLEVYATNDCGDSPLSDQLNILVHAIPVPFIVGYEVVCENTEEIYFTDGGSGNIYNWEVEGGIITQGAGTEEITILWGEHGDGSIVLTELSPEGCSVTTEPFNVSIEVCPGIDEKTNDNIRVVPNPTSGTFNIIGTDYDLVKVFNYSGLLILQTDDPNTALDISGKPSGVYLVQIIIDDIVLTRRIVLE